MASPDTPSPALFSALEKFTGVAALLLVCLLVDTSIYLYRSNDLNEQVERQAGAIQAELISRLHSADAILASVTGLHLASDDLSNTERVAFSHELVSAYPFVSYIGEAPLVSAARRQAFEEQMERMGFVSLRIRESAGVGRLRAAGYRDFYLPLEYVEPVEPETTRAIGYDLLSEAVLEPMIFDAIDSGEARISAPLELITGKRGVMMAKVVYRGNTVPTTVQQRRSDAARLIVLFLHSGDLVSHLPVDGVTRLTLTRLDSEEHVGGNVASISHDVASNRFLQGSYQVERDIVSHGGTYRLSVAFATRRFDTLFATLATVDVFIVLLGIVGYLGLRAKRRAQRQDEETMHRLYEERERAEVTLHSIADAIISTDTDGKILYMNANAERLTGCKLAAARNRPAASVFHIEDEASGKPVMSEQVSWEKNLDLMAAKRRCLLRGTNGSLTAIDESSAPVTDENENIIGTVLVFRDVGHERELANRLEYQASHDALTDLMNRSAFERAVEHSLHSATGGITHALCFMDLDQFKVVNDTCGHVAGDQLLRQVSAMLQVQVRKSDILARLGGDEFGLLMVNCPLTRARDIAESLCKTVRELAFNWDGQVFNIGVSIGVVAINAQSIGLADVMAEADAACYVAKEKGRNCVHISVPDDKSIAERHGEMRWFQRIETAMRDHRLLLATQTIHKLNDACEFDEIVEFLLRMRGEDGELITPMAFIPAAERYSLMPKVDEWVVKAALNMIAKWSDATTASSKRRLYTINLSGQTLGNTQTNTAISSALAASGVAPESVCFEITESAAIANFADASQFIKVMQNLGCRFALDDFGSGLSSFGHLKSLPVDFIKIDGQFVRDMLDDPVDKAMVRSVQEIGEILNIPTIAEFVESAALRDELTKMGIDYAQGYYFSKPQIVDSFDSANVHHMPVAR